MDYDQLLQEALARVEQVRRNATDDDTAAAGPVVREELKAIERRLHLVRFALASWQPESSSGEKELSTDGGVDAPGTLHRVVRARKLLGETDRDAFSTRGGARILNALEALDNLLLDDLDRFVAGCEQNELATDGGEDLADASDDVDAEEWERSRKRHGLRSSIPVHVDVDVPRAAWDLVRDRDDPMAGLLDFLEHEYRVSVDGEEVHRTAGYREAAEE